MRLGEILINRGKATPDQVAAAREKQRSSSKSLGRILVDDGVVGESDVLSAMAEEFGCASVAAIDEALLDPALVSSLPVEWARSHVMLPVRWKDGVGVLTNDPSAIARLDDLSLLLGAELALVLAPRDAILKAIERCYFRKTDTTQDLLKDMAEKGGDEVSAPASVANDLLRMADQAPVTQLVNVILLEAVKARASDVHVEPFEKHLRIRYRIDGMLYEQAAPPKHLEAALVSRLKVMARLDIAERRLPQDGTARVRVGEREIDIRVSTIPVAEGERVVLRLLNRDSAVLPLSDLGMPEGVLSDFRSVIQQPNGVVLVTGPTGSGKTTTLYAAIQELDTAHRNVLTIEDPIEYQLPRIGQMQVKPKIGLAFAQGLRHILRQDPDVILVGETRDLETAEIVVRASLTGHLVFSTLHTNDATSAAVRMVDMGIEPYLLSSAFRAALAQRLVRVLCPHCRAEVDVATADELPRAIASRLEGKRTWRAVGCPACLGGYRGRTGIYELMIAGPDIQEAIRAGRSAQGLRAKALALGMKSLLEDALDKVVGGITSVGEVIRTVGHGDSDGGV